MHINSIKHRILFIFLVSVSLHSNLYSKSNDTLEANGKILYFISNIFNDDVLKAFGLENKLNSELKIKVFKESEDYFKLQDSLNNLKNYFLEKTYKLVIPVEIPNYDLNLKGFNIELNKVYITYMAEKFIEPTFEEFQSIIYDIEGGWFNSLNLSARRSYGTLHQQLFISSDEQTALKIEKQNVECIFYFKLNGDTINKFVEHIGYGNKYYLQTYDVSLYINFNRENFFIQ